MAFRNVPKLGYKTVGVTRVDQLGIKNYWSPQGGEDLYLIPAPPPLSQTYSKP